METAEQKLKPTTYLDTRKLRPMADAQASREVNLTGKPHLGRLTPSGVNAH